MEIYQIEKEVTNLVENPDGKTDKQDLTKTTLLNLVS